MDKRDVVVVGAGPAGSAAAKKCADYGLKILMLEKRQLPRDKVCSGMVMGPVAYTLIKQEFGDIPDAVLSQPRRLNGIAFHVPGVGSKKLENDTLLTWRRNLDYWMNQQAQHSGAEIWQDARVVGLKDAGQGFLVRIKRGGEEYEIETKFLIGADGAISTVRKFLFPDFRVRYAPIYQECYSGELELDKEYIHWFYPIERSPKSFTAHHKDNLIILDVSGGGGQARENMGWWKDFLCKNYQFNYDPEPVLRGGCLEPVLYRELTSNTFSPAKGNALLVGDAAGFLLPVSGEGIGTALQSGLFSADSVKEALESGKQPDKIYSARIETIISAFKGDVPVVQTYYRGNEGRWAGSTICFM